MLDLLTELAPLLAAGEQVAVATVVRTFQSAPRPAGAAMAVLGSGEAVGSVSGGCVEGAVYEAGLAALADGPAVLQRYGVSDDDAFAVGLTCGGIIDIFVEALSADAFPALGEVTASVRAGDPVAVATVLTPGPHVGAHLAVWPDRVGGSLGLARLDDAVTADARGFLAAGRTGVLHYGEHGERRGDAVEVFVEAHVPPARMLVFGAIDFASALARLGKFLGYHVTVCDARAVFATPRRFPDADEVVVDWPHRFLDTVSVDARTAVCVLTHDPKFDVPLLEKALATPAGYIGVMGSRRTHAERLALLAERGVAAADLARLASPIGLDIGARTPEETAVSIAAELIALRWGGTGRRLSDTEGPIHADDPAVAVAPGTP